MRLISFSVTFWLALLSSHTLAQQSPGTTGDTIGHPPYSTGTLPEMDTTGRTIVGSDGSTKTVRAAPCGKAAHETDGSTTCIGIPDTRGKAKKNP
jgi:hypothetical protein